jgi:hypothetical protein
MELGSSLASEIINVVLLGAPNPPVDLSRVAEEVGASVRQTWGTRFLDGFTDFRSGSPVIYLGRKAESIRARFIFAHEIAHVMLRTPAAEDAMMRHGQTCLSQEEKLANRIAASLLVPDWVVEDIARCSLALARLDITASQIEVSITMLVARLASAGLDIALLHWRKAKRSWYVVDRPGAPLSLHGRIQLSEAGVCAIGGLSRKESQVTVDGYVNGKYMKLSATGFRDSRNAFLLIRPSRDIWLRNTAGAPIVADPEAREVLTAPGLEAEYLPGSAHGA